MGNDKRDQDKSSWPKCCGLQTCHIFLNKEMQKC